MQTSVPRNRPPRLGATTSDRSMKNGVRAGAPDVGQSQHRRKATETSQRRMSMMAVPRTWRKERRTTRGAIAGGALPLGGGADAAVESAADSVVSTADQSALNGTYRFVISDADLRVHGVTNPGVI